MCQLPGSLCKDKRCPPARRQHRRLQYPVGRLPGPDAPLSAQCSGVARVALGLQASQTQRKHNAGCSM